MRAGYGMWTNKRTTFINASVCSSKFKPDHDPIVFDFPLPKGFQHEDFARLSTDTLREARQRRRDLAARCQQGTNNGVAADSLMEREPVERNGDNFESDAAAANLASIHL